MVWEDEILEEEIVREDRILEQVIWEGRILEEMIQEVLQLNDLCMCILCSDDNDNIIYCMYYNLKRKINNFYLYLNYWCVFNL